MRTRSLITITALAGLAGLWLGPSPAAGSQGSFTFRTSVSGKGHDSGTISAPEHATNTFDATGCAIVKQTGSAKKIYGTYVFEVRFIGANPVIAPGLKPKGPYVLLEVSHFRPSVATYRSLDVSGTFAINGHVYGASVSQTSVVRLRNGGRDGSWSASQAQRVYPPKGNLPVPGYSFRATWHCATVFHLTAPNILS